MSTFSRCYRSTREIKPSFLSRSFGCILGECLEAGGVREHDARIVQTRFDLFEQRLGVGRKVGLTGLIVMPLFRAAPNRQC